MFKELVELGIFDELVDYTVKLRTAQEPMEFLVRVLPMTRALEITSLGPFQPSKDPIAMFGPSGWDIKFGYPEEMMDNVILEVKAQLLAKRAGKTTDPEPAGMPLTAKPLAIHELVERLVKRGIFEARIPDILVGQMLVRVDRTLPEKPVFQMGKLYENMMSMTVEANWYLVYNEEEGLTVMPGLVSSANYNRIIGEALRKYDAIIDGLVVNADNGLLQ